MTPTPAPGNEDKSASRRILLIEDDHLVRAGLKMLLERTYGFTVRDAADAAEARKLAGSVAFDLALIDVHMPGEDGISFLRWLRGYAPDLPCILLSGRGSSATVKEALALGAKGFVIKGATAEQFREAIDVALGHVGIYLHPRVAQNLFSPGSQDEVSLTFRESQVLALLAQGSSNVEIALALSVGQKAVKGDLSSIFRKFGVENRTEAVARAVRDDLI